MQENNNIYEIIFDNSSIGKVLLYPNGRIFKVNKKLSDIFSLNKVDLENQPFDKVFNIKEISEVLDPTSNSNYYTEDNYITKSGSIIKFSIKSSLLKNENDELIYYIIEIQDITEQKKIEEKLNKKENQYETIIKNFPNGLIVLFDHDLRYESANGERLADLGLSSEGMEGKTIWEVFPEEISKGIEPIYRATLNGEISKRIRTYGDNVLLSHFLPIRDDNNKIILGMNMALDISELKKREEELEDAHNKLHKIRERLELEVKERTAQLELQSAKLNGLFMNAPAIICVFEGPEHIFTLSNPIHDQLYGHRQLIGKTIREVAPELENQGIFEMLDDVYKTKQPFFGNEVRVEIDKNNDGNLITTYFNFVYQPFFDTNNQTQGISVFAFDITEQVKSRQQIEKINTELTLSSNKLAIINKELEAFSYAVSHDLRTPLRSIDGFSRALLELYSDKIDERGKDFLNRIRSATQKMGNLIDDLLKLSRISKSEIKLEKVDLSQLVYDISEMSKNNFEHKVDVTIQEKLFVEADKQLLTIALENLINNSYKFTSKVSDATIKFGCIIDDCNLIFFIKDNGAGFDMKYADKLFGAFQRLHRATEFPGTGVGLATVRRIIHKHGGEIWADSEINKGTTFFFSIPKI